MEFLGDAGAGAAAPDEAALRAHFEAHPERFTPPARITFRHVFLGDEDPAPVLAALAEGAEPDALGRATSLPPALRAATRSEVDGVFGAGVFAAVSALPPGEWSGPVMSGYGAHLVQVLESEPARAPDFAAVRHAVEADWRHATAEAQREALFEALRERYVVILPTEGG